jgi:hypothetical protein
MDGVMRDAERLGVRNWRIKVKDRDGWRRLLESVKTLHGLQCLGVSDTFGEIFPSNGGDRNTDMCHVINWV